MFQNQEKQARIKVKKISIRGDEVAILFFSLVFLVFLLLSFFRMFAMGKLFDDFIFTFLFGWSKYLVYLFLFIIVLPICFNRYFRFKVSFVLAVFLSIFAISWLVANISLIVQTQSQGTNIWLKFKGYSFADFSNYFNQWWDSTIINNYHGFFAEPISFASWTNVDSFFPSFAAGGVIAYVIIAITNYGFFVSNFVLNLIMILISFSWMFFSRPWLFFALVFFFLKPLHARVKEKKIKQISEQSAKHKMLLDFKEEHKSKPENKAIVRDSFLKVGLKAKDDLKDSNRTPEKNNLENKAIVRDSFIRSEVQTSEGLKDSNAMFDKNGFENKAIIRDSFIISEVQANNDANKAERELHRNIKESGSLTPFSQLKQDPTIDMNFVVSDDEKFENNK